MRLASQAHEVSAGRQHKPYDVHDVCTDPLVAKLSLQADLNQRKGSEKCTFPAASGPCIGRSAAAAALATGGSFPIATRRRQSSASALLDFVSWLAKRELKETPKQELPSLRIEFLSFSLAFSFWSHDQP